MLELAAAFELARRGFSGDDDGDNGMPAKISGVKQAVTAFSVGLRGKREQENFFVLPINTKLVPLSEPICISRGTLSSTPAHPREVFREAVRWGAHAIFICHNHPSGDVTPSDEDKALTKRLVDVGKLVAIPVVDHIILGSSPTSDKYFSMREEGMMGK